MPQNPIASLDEAITGLELELSQDPKFVLLQSLKTARAAFGGAATRPRPVGAAIAGEARAPDPERATGRRLNPARQQALTLSEEFLSSETGTVKTKDIYTYVELSGGGLPGGANNLASLLGRFPAKFKSHGRQGWTLVSSDADASENEIPEEGEEEPETTDELISPSTSVASMSSLPDQQGTTYRVGP